MDVSKQAERIVKIVLKDLKDRGGFDMWWNQIDTITREDLITTLESKVRNGLV